MAFIAVQLSVLGSYFPPLFKYDENDPPQTSISLPVHTALCPARPSGDRRWLSKYRQCIRRLPIFSEADSYYSALPVQ